MCLKLIYHNLACDVRPRVARNVQNSPIVNPYAAPIPCHQECYGKEHIAPYFRCLTHKCCMTSAKYVHTGCTSRCSPGETTNYHVYNQRLGSTPINVKIQQWEPLPTIDSYIPKLQLAVPAAPNFRQWRSDLLAKGAEVQQVIELMDLVETRLAEELLHQRKEHHICQRLEAEWQKCRRFADEPRPEKCRNKENVGKLWKKLTQLSEFLQAAESEYQALQTPPLGVTDFSGLITSLHPLVQSQRRYNRYTDAYQKPLDDLKDTVHQLAVFRF